MKAILRVAWLLALVLLPAAILAQAPCTAAHDAALQSIADARLGRGLEQKLTSKVENAWRMYVSGTKNAQKNALQQLDVALRQLEGNATRQIPPALRNEIAGKIAALRDCIASGAEPTGARLTVKVLAPNPDDPAAYVAVAGALVRINDVEAGTTDANGLVTLDVAAGYPITVAAVRYPSEFAEHDVTIASGGSATVELKLMDGHEPIEPTTLELVEAPEGTLVHTFSSFTFRFLDENGAPATLRRVEFIDLMRNDQKGSNLQTEAFRVGADGTSIVPVDINAWRNILTQQGGKLQMSVSASDSRRRTHFGRITFYLARFRVTGRLAAPPSNPTLPVAGVFVTANVLNTDIVFRAVSDALGTFTFPLLPQGNLEIEAVTTSPDGKYYYGDAVATLTRDMTITVNLLHTQDKINGVPPFQSALFGGSAAAESAAATPERARAEAARRLSIATDSFAPAADADPTSVNITVTGGARDAAISRNATLHVPQGTQKVLLRYEVSTAEYPFYVLSNSIYNDWWYVEVTVSPAGSRLFRRLRQINSQLYLEPTWQTNGRTGELQYELDVSGLTASTPISVTVQGTTANIGDSALPTTINATLSLDFNVSITGVFPDVVNGWPAPLWPRRTRGDSTYFSIPAAGLTNRAQRYLTFGVSKPTAATIQNVKVYMKGISGVSPFMVPPGTPIVDEAIGAGAITQLPGGDYRVRVTFEGANTSPFTATPPPAHRIRYLVKLTAELNGATKVVERETMEWHSLWRMPGGFARYGQPYQTPAGQDDIGFDDWVSMPTYHWMEANRPLLTSINDISGEHAANTGHQGHLAGRDIDMFLFVNFTGGTWATGNYIALGRRVQRIASSDPAVAAAARAEIAGWITATRTGLDALAALYDVDWMRATLGDIHADFPGLSEGWARSLTTTGRVRIGGTDYDLGVGTWANAKVNYDHVHDNHIHIALRDADF